MLSASELERMRASVRPTEPTDTETRRLRLKKLSDEKVRTWPNTLEATRKKKEMRRSMRLEEEEKQRIIIDREEEELQKKLRLAAIHRANEILYAQTDRMKGLKSQISYSDVVHERKSQVESKEWSRREELEREQKYHEAMIVQLEQADLREQASKEAKRMKAESIAAVQREQLGEFQQRHIERLKAEKKDGELVLKRAQFDLEEDERIMREKDERSRFETKQTLLANERLKELRRAAQKQEDLAEEKRKAEVVKKERFAKERKRLEDVRFQARQATKQKLIDRATEELTHRLKEDNRKLERQVEEQRRKEEDLAARKRENIRKQKAAIDLSRSQQLEAKQIILQQEAKLVADSVEAWKIKNDEIEAEEARQAEERRAQNLAIRRAQQEQIEVNRRAKHHQTQQDVEWDKRAKEAAEEDDRRFKATASECIKTAESEGKPTYMLYKALHAKERALQPATGLKV